MSELLVTVLRLSYLILLWLLVLSAVAVLRRDVFGTRVVNRRKTAAAAARPATGRGAVVGQPGPPPRVRASIAGAGVAVAPAPVAPAALPQTAPPATTPPPQPAPRATATPPAVAPAPPAPTARLAVVEGSLAGTTVPLTSSAVTIGRGPACTLVLTDDYASTRHARVYPQEGGWWVEDLGSTNGTFVDGERIDSPQELRPGTPFRVGRTVLELRG